ncbi:hypothetical protein PV797_01625 [Clostridiaceae bacterium M8S5]|nr:hypothetical protein PV797_01625 [Clostridiaceae bacterium M8S5]
MNIKKINRVFILWLLIINIIMIIGYRKGFNVKELKDEITKLSAENIQLQRDLGKSSKKNENKIKDLTILLDDKERELEEMKKKLVQQAK